MAKIESVQASDYVGFYRTYWNYTNADSNGAHTNSCCGQAAIYSALRTRFGSQKLGFPAFVRKYPPDIVGGSFGTSWQRIRQTVVASGYKLGIQYGETALHNALNSGPVIVCLDVGAAGWGKPGLHWVSVFGRTSKHYYLTQWQGGGGNRVSREHFLAGWQTWLTTGLSATSRGCYIPYK